MGQKDGKAAGLWCNYSVTPEDFGAYATYTQRRAMLRAPGVLFRMLGALAIGFAAVLAGLIIVAAQKSEAPIINAGAYTELAVAGVLLALAAIAVFAGLIPAIRMQKNAAAAFVSEDGPLTGDFLLEASADGLVVTGSHMQTVFRWSAFEAIESRNGAVYLIVDAGAGVIVPKSAFETKEERLQFMAQANELFEAARG